MYMFQPQIFKLSVCTSNLNMLSISDLLENALQDTLLNINLVTYYSLFRITEKLVPLLIHCTVTDLNYSKCMTLPQFSFVLVILI